MPSLVAFPNGEREVPSHTRHIVSQQTGKVVQSYEYPDADEDWEFQILWGGKIRAYPKD
jgi:hypothetical protein